MYRYVDNSVAVIINEITPHKKRYSAFDNDKKGTCLLAIDENAVGFCNTSKSKSKKKIGIRIAFSKIGAVVTDIEGNIQYDWKWDRRGRDSGIPPATPITVELNDFLTFKMKDTRENMTLIFKAESAIHTFEIGLKLKRTDTYLDNCTKLPGGHLLPKLEYKTLKNRQVEFNEKMSGLRNKNNPKSENLSEMVRGVVAQLEENFDDVSNRMKTSVNFTTTWKSDALSSTLSEIPKILTAGTEIGNISGYGDHIYTSSSESRLSSTAPAILMNASGKWKDEMDVRMALKEVNPPLKRSVALQVASGRYSAQLVVDPLRVTVDNPTGMTEVDGKPLETMSWIKLKEIIASSSLGSNSVLFVVLLMRCGDPVGLLCNRIASMVNKHIEHNQSRASSPTSLSARPASNRTSGLSSSTNIRNKFRLVRIDICENNDADKELGIRSLPNFAMFYGGAMVYAGLLGGRTVKSSTIQSRKPRVLLVEPNFHDQIEIEKSLKRENCDVFLCLSVHQAIDRIQAIDVTNPNPYDLVLISEDIQDQEVGILGQRLAQFTKSQTTVICALASIMGQKGKEHLNAVSWKQYCTTEVMGVISNPLSKIVSIATQKPLKAAAIEKLLSLRIPTNDTMVTGLTPETLLAKMNQIVTQGGMMNLNKTFQGTSGSSNSVGYIGIRLSTEDINIRGKDLVASHLDYNQTKK